MRLIFASVSGLKIVPSFTVTAMAMPAEPPLLLDPVLDPDQGRYRFDLVMPRDLELGVVDDRLALGKAWIVLRVDAERDLAGKEVRFKVQNDPPHAAGSTQGNPLRVLYKSLETPDLFKSGAEVVVEAEIPIERRQPVIRIVRI